MPGLKQVPPASKTCVACGKEFRRRVAIYESPGEFIKRKTCSRTCSAKLVHPKGLASRPRRGVTKPCEVCGKDMYITPAFIKKRFCSRGCQHQAQMTNRPLVCEICGQEFYVSRSQEAQRNRKTCSRKCQWVWQSRNVRGERTGNWKGGITPENVMIRTGPQMNAWRIAVFRRDNCTCQRCGARSAKGNPVQLHAHHIKPFAGYPELRFKLGNGLTLCYPCHRAVHREMKEAISA